MPTLDDILGKTEAKEPPKLGSMLMDAAVGIAPPGMAERVGNFAKPSLMPTAGSLALPAAATAIMGPANIPFIPAERAIGSGIGTLGNWATGITDPSVSEMALSVGLPLGMEYGANVIRAGSKFLGGKGAETLNALAPVEATKKVAGFRSGQNVTQLFKEATEEGVRVPLSKTQAMVQQIENEVASATPAGKQAWKGILRKTGADDLVTNPDGASPAQLQNILADVGKMEAEAAAGKKGLITEKLGKLFGALSDDLDNVPKLDKARQVFKRETVLDDVEKAINKAFRLGGGQEAEEFSANKVFNTLSHTDNKLGKFFSQAFNKGEQKEILDFFKFLNTIPDLAPGAGQQFGAGKQLARVLTPSIVGGGLGTLFGGPGIGSAIGVSAGALLPPTVDAGKMMLQAWRMEGGKQLIKNLLTNSDGALTPQVLGTIGAFISGQASEQIRPPEMSGAGTLRPFAMQP